MSMRDMLDDSFPHGTPAGYTRGCKTESHCPAPVSCMTVWMREKSDYGFAKKLAAGIPAAQIIAEEQAAAKEAARAAAAVRAQQREHARAVPKRTRKAAPAAPRRDPKAPTAERARAKPERVAADAERRKAERAEKLRVRAAEKEARAEQRAKERAKEREQRRAERAAARKPRELKPHGTPASFARGCRCDECVEGNRAYHREYGRRRAAGAGKVRGGAEKHGTAFGFRNGCKTSEQCPSTPSCAEVMRDYDRKRARAAGRPERVLVDADEVRAHIRSLNAAGMPLLEIAARAGVSKSVLKNMLYGRSPAAGRDGSPSRFVKRETAAALLSVQVESEVSA
jgi:hypothetical protein